MKGTGRNRLERDSTMNAGFGGAHNAFRGTGRDFVELEIEPVIFTWEVEERLPGENGRS